MRRQNEVSALVSIALVAFLCRIAAAGERVERDIGYGADRSERLDLYVPEARDFPTIIFIHGGSLTDGDKGDDDYKNVCEPFPKAGIGCATANYRLGPAHPGPAQARDVAAAVDWVRANIEARGGDPAKLYLFGHSSGALLAALVGSDERYLAALEMKLSNLRGVVAMGSIMWDVELENAMRAHGRAQVKEALERGDDGRMFGSLEAYEDHWPIRHVHAGLPRFLFLVAEKEQEHPPVFATDRKFVEEARKLRNEAQVRVLPGRTHASAIRKLAEPDDPAFAIVCDFVKRP
jgi:acetyl esterase/lipase